MALGLAVAVVAGAGLAVLLPLTQGGGAPLRLMPSSAAVPSRLAPTVDRA